MLLTEPSPLKVTGIAFRDNPVDIEPYTSVLPRSTVAGGSGSPGTYVQYMEYLVPAVEEVPNVAGIPPVHFSAEIALPGVPEVYLVAMAF